MDVSSNTSPLFSFRGPVTPSVLMRLGEELVACGCPGVNVSSGRLIVEAQGTRGFGIDIFLGDTGPADIWIGGLTEYIEDASTLGSIVAMCLNGEARLCITSVRGVAKLWSLEKFKPPGHEATQVILASGSALLPGWFTGRWTTTQYRQNFVLQADGGSPASHKTGFALEDSDAIFRLVQNDNEPQKEPGIAENA